MLTAGAEYLFPAFILTSVVLILFIIKGNKLCPEDWTILGMIILSFGAMILSPHYPDRATFGTMVFCIILLVTVLGKLAGENLRYSGCAAALTCFSWIYAICTLLMGYIV